MKLGQIWIENFMSIEKAYTDFRNRGLVLIQGRNDDADAFESNGSGKSTTFSEAPVWALFGETIRGQKGDKVINRAIGKNTRIALEIIDDNGDSYLIERHRKHKEHNNHVRLFRNDTNITGKSDTDTNEMIKELIQMDFSTFINSIMFGQGISKMFASSTDGEQKKILENMLQIDIFKACQDKAKQYLSETDRLRTDLQSEIDSEVKHKQVLKQSIESMQNREAELEQKINKRIQELEDEWEGYNNEMQDLPDVSGLLNDKQTYESLSIKLRDKIEVFNDYEGSLRDLLSDKKSIQRDIRSIVKEIDTKKEELDDIQNGKNIPKTCETCGQDLPLEDTSHIENHLKDGIEKLEFNLQEKENEVIELDVLISKLHDALEDKKPLEKQRDELQDTINSINIEIRLSESREEEITRALKRIKDQIEEQESMRDTTYTDLIEEAYVKVKSIDSNLEVCYDRMKQLDKDHSDYSFWSSAYGNQGIKSVLLDSVTPFLNQRANHYLSKLADSSIEVKFNTQQTLKSGEKRDRFTVDVINRNGDDEYRGNSNGEKRRIDLAVNLALQDLVASRSNKRIDLVVYDEAFEGMDGIGCEALIEILQEKATKCGTIMVITHNDQLKQLFNKTLTVSKRNGRTVIEDD